MSAQEKAYYDALWSRADTNSDGKLNGSEAVAFLRESGLSVDQLEEVWNVIDTTKKGYLTQIEFYHCMRLLGLVLNGAEPSAALLQRTTHFPVPVFSSLSIAVPSGLPTARVASGVRLLPATVSAAKIAEYQLFFSSVDVQRTGFIDGVRAREFFMKSKLPKGVLGRVWQLSDVSNDGKLSLNEFVLAMHLVESILSGCKVPTPLPRSLHPKQILNFNQS